MRASDPILDALRTHLEERARKLARTLRRARRGEHEGVHDARALLRRLRTELDAFSSALPAGRARRLARRLHALEHALSPARDAEVLLGHVQAYRAKNRAEGASLDRLERRAARRCARATKRGRDAVRAGERRRIARAIGRLAEDARVPEGPRAEVRDVRREIVWRAYDAMRAHEDAPADPESLHAFRASCRRLRFVVELLAESMVGAQAIARALTDVQDRLGTLHDHVVAIDRIERWIARGDLREDAALARYLARRRREVAHFRARSTRRVLAPAFRARLAAALERER